MGSALSALAKLCDGISCCGGMSITTGKIYCCSCNDKDALAKAKSANVDAAMNLGDEIQSPSNVSV